MEALSNAMSLNLNRSVRIAFDLQACQTAGSATRGVGRYSKALFDAMLATGRGDDIHAVVSEALPHQVTFKGMSQDRVLRLPPLPDWGAARQYNGGAQDQLDALAVSSYLAPLKADVVHVSHVFEGFGDRVGLPAPHRRARGQILSATLYDLIPLLFQDHYFQSNEFRKWYLSRLTWLRQADLLLAISESSRQDAINFLGIEPWRIATIHGGISDHFKPPGDRKTIQSALRARYQLKDRFVLYTGGDDHRKNIDGAILGYAAVPAEARATCQLVIICAMEDHRKEMYLGTARNAGLSDADVLITGFIPEADLVAFYQCCDVFVFPSLYEGLGLPVLEAMACGAPAIGGDNSSVREIIVRPDAMFNAGSAKSIAEAISKVLLNGELAQNLRKEGLERAKQFSWARSAQLAGEAFVEAMQRSQLASVQCAVNGWLPKKRLAVLSPLPPCRSGIADYNAKFLPHLARHFEIDLYVDNYAVSDETLTSSFAIHDVRNFEQVAANYDAILYEFGNSEFHHHMLPLLEKFPGVVGLHDAYLSGMIGYLDFYLGDTGSYSMAMVEAHGPRARRYYAPVQKHPEPNGTTMVELPCTKRVLDLATGVISHSPFNLEVANANYPEGWQAPYRIIPQMVPLPQAWSHERKADERALLGYGKEDIVIATFGHIAWTKWGDRLLEAFLSSGLKANHHVHLLFAGELAKDDFGTRLNETIAAADLGDRIKITGFLTESDFERYLRIADIAVQLRTKSRGGTPKGVLDCLAYGLPVVVNNDASYRDYPDDVVGKLSPDPSTAEIADKLLLLIQRPDERMSLAAAGVEYVKANHDPALCAAKYAAAIDEFGDREKRTTPADIVTDLAPLVARSTEPAIVASHAVKWIESVPAPLFSRRRLIVDVSHIAQTDHETGIQRVVKEIVRGLYCAKRAGFEPLAVELVDGNIVEASRWLQAKGLQISREITVPAYQRKAVSFRPGDVFLMLDSSWGRFKEFLPVFADARAAHVPVYTAVYDLLPITLPAGNFVEGGKEWFESWLKDAIKDSDGLVCISRATADSVSRYMHAQGAAEASHFPRLGYWHLGADFSSLAPTNIVAEHLEPILKSRYLLMVGTIEPRKSHALALAAMEQLWASGHDLCLCIAGKEGWMVGELMQKLRNHPQAGKKLFLLEKACDQDIATLYATSKGLLFLSKGEGFGLPLVEAAHYGVPIICSDIPVFREIAGKFATYIGSDDPKAVARELAAWWKKYRAVKLPNTKDMPRLTWEESASSLLKVVLDDEWIA